VIDLSTGANVQSLEADPTSEGSGFDGTTPWMRDLSGAFTTQEGGDRIPVAVSEAYRDANLWWRTDHGGAVITYAGQDTVDGTKQDHLIVEPKGGRKFDAWFDSTTHQLTRTAEDRMFFHTQTFYQDYRPENGAVVAHKRVEDGGTGKDNYYTLTLNSFAVSAAQPLTAYARPTTPPTGVTFDGEAASVTIPFRLLNNHIYVQGMVNGKGPYTFIVDTGGHTVLGPRIVKEAGLSSVGATPGTGAGAKVIVSGFVRVGEVAIGGVRLHDQTAIAQPVYDKTVEGIDVDGMVGFELIRRVALKIDYGARTLTFTDPAKFAPVDAGTAFPFKFYDHLPQIPGTIGELSGVFDIDTGSRSEVDITSPNVAKENLRSHNAKGVEAITGWGVGGPTTDYVVRLPVMTFGDIATRNVVGVLSAPDSGSLSDPNYLGNVGGGFLKRFVVTLDYAHQMLWLKPIEPPPADVGTFDRSGVWLNAGDHGFVAVHVSPGGPAQRAGLLKDDVVTAVDGKPVQPGDLPAIRVKLRNDPPGTEVTFDVLRGREKKTLKIFLRDQI
jgi:hypothetical protein